MSRRPLFSRLLHACLVSRKNIATRRKAFTFRPSLETLEERSLPSVTPLHLYDFSGALTDQMGGPALAADGGTLTSSRYLFNPGQGLRLTGGPADITNYSGD